MSVGVHPSVNMPELPTTIRGDGFLLTARLSRAVPSAVLNFARGRSVVRYKYSIKLPKIKGVRLMFWMKSNDVASASIQA